MKIERDAAEVTSGVRHGRTLGGPIALQVANRDYANWEERMNPWPVEADVPEVHLPRPGHADLAGVQKFGFTDVRNVLERASAARDRRARRRRRAGQGVPARARRRGRLPRHADRLGPGAGAATSLALADFADVDASPVRCLDADALEGDGRGDQRAAQAQRVARRHLRGARVRARARASARTSRGRSASTAASALAMLSIQAVKGCRDRRRLRPRRPPGLGGPRRDLLLRGARLLPRDEPLRRHRGRHDDRRAAGRARAR